MRLILIPIIGLLCTLYACNNELTVIGQEIIGNDNHIGEKSIPVFAATVKADSFATSCGLYASSYIEKLVMGRYDDAYSGVTTAIPCFQIAPQNVPSTLPENAVLDSVTFNFTYAGNMWGDTTYGVVKPQKYSLHQLKEFPELEDDIDQSNTLFYNTKKVNIIDKPIATTSFYPLVENMAYAYFKVDQNLGETLFQQIIFRGNPDTDIYNPEAADNIPYYNFLHYFKGLAIVPDESNDCLMTIHALSDSLYLEFHYSIAGDEYSLKFPLAQREYQYNSIVNEPTATLETLTNPQNEVTFEEATFALTQGMCGYMTKLILPEAPGFDQYTTLIKAEIEIKPEFMNNNPVSPPQEISVYTTNDINELTGFLYNNGESLVSGRLVKNETATDKTRYIFDMTEYYQRVSAAPPTAERQQVLLSVPNDGYSSTGISFDQMVVRETPILRVQYAKYK